MNNLAQQMGGLYVQQPHGQSHRPPYAGNQAETHNYQNGDEAISGSYQPHKMQNGPMSGAPSAQMQPMPPTMPTQMRTQPTLTNSYPNHAANAHDSSSIPYPADNGLPPTQFGYENQPSAAPQQNMRPQPPLSSYGQYPTSNSNAPLQPPPSSQEQPVRYDQKLPSSMQQQPTWPSYPNRMNSVNSAGAMPPQPPNAAMPQQTTPYAYNQMPPPQQQQQQQQQQFYSYQSSAHQPLPHMPSAHPYPQTYENQHMQQQPKRLDPEAMPNPIQVMSEDQEHHQDETFVTNQIGQVPPLVTTRFCVEDEGNANPRFIRSTMYSVPCSLDMVKLADIPFSLVITPLATLAPQERLPPIVNTGEFGPVRCVRCKAYMNPFMKFIDGGRRFVCVLCSGVTEVPGEYFQHLDHTGSRVDRYEKPELIFGAYEFTVTKEYCKDNEIPNVPAFIFVIDVSYNNIKSGLVNLLCEQMCNILRDHLPRDELIDVREGDCVPRIRVGFITYDSTVHFYNIKACLGQPQMMIVGDTDDMFVPLLDGFLCDPIESQTVIASLMRQIPTTFGNTRETDTLLLPAVKAGLEALKAAKCAGKLLVFHSSLPTANVPGKLVNREDRKLLATDKEKTVLTPQNNSYTSLAQDCVKNSCSVDLFVFNNAHIDLPTIGELAKITGGEIFKYTYFQANIDGVRFVLDLQRNLERQIAFDAVMRVRTSTGIRPVNFYGHLLANRSTDIELASINADKSIAVEIKHEDKLNEEDGVFIQVALLYTSCWGQRRVRILNLTLKCCSIMGELFRSCELDTLVNYWAKSAVDKLIEGPPRQLKESLISRSVRLLACYRKLCANPSSPGQLILPESMRLLPLYVNCLLKCDAISGGSDMTVDDKYYMMRAVSIMDIPSSVNYLYPRLIPLVGISYSTDEIPSSIRCTSYKLSSSEAYILENGIYMFLWLGSTLPKEWIHNVFGVSDFTHINASMAGVPLLENAYSKRINTLIAQIQNERRHSLKLTIVREGDKMEVVFKRFLVEDGISGVYTGGSMSSASYVDFLCEMHKEIRNVLS